jgi:hypothetical protein
MQRSDRPTRPEARTRSTLPAVFDPFLRTLSLYFAIPGMSFGLLEVTTMTYEFQMMVHSVHPSVRAGTHIRR